MGDMPLSSLVRGHRQCGIRLRWNFRKSYFVSIVKKTRLTPGRNGPADGLFQYLTCVTAQRSSLVIRATTIPMRLIVSCHPPRDSGFQASLRQISGVAGKKPTDLRSVCRWRYFVGFLRSRLREKCVSYSVFHDKSSLIPFSPSSVAGRIGRLRTLIGQGEAGF